MPNKSEWLFSNLQILYFCVECYVNKLLLFLFMSKAKTRGLPEGYVGEVRVIVIEGVDRNMCCGTHVSNLRQLEVSGPLINLNSICNCVL